MQIWRRRPLVMAPGVRTYFRSPVHGEVAGHRAQIGPQISVTLRIGVVPEPTCAAGAIILGLDEATTDVRRESQDRAKAVLATEPSARLRALLGHVRRGNASLGFVAHTRKNALAGDHQRLVEVVDTGRHRFQGARKGSGSAPCTVCKLPSE